MRTAAAVALLWAAAVPAFARRALLLDYELRPASYADALIGRLAAAGFEVDHRQFYPLLTRSDFETYDLVALLDPAGAGGSGLVPDRRELRALEAFVRSGGLLVLGLPASASGFELLKPWNKLLDRLDAGIEALPYFPADKTRRYDATLLSWFYYQPVPGTFASEGVGDRLVLDRGPILQVSPPAQALAKASASAYAVSDLDDSVEQNRRVPLNNFNGFPVVAWSPAGRGAVLVTSYPILNGGGYNGVPSFQPMTTDAWTADTDRFLRNAIAGLARVSRSVSATPELTRAAAGLPAEPPKTCGLVRVPRGGSLEPSPAEVETERSRFLAGVRRDLYGAWLDDGVRAGWLDADRDDPWLHRMAARSKAAGLNTLWAVGYPEQLLPGGATPSRQKALEHAWGSLADELQGSSVTWLVGLHDPPWQDNRRYERSWGPAGKLQILSPFDDRIWDERILPELEEIARFSLKHPAVGGAALDIEMYGFSPIGYPQSAVFEDAAFRFYLGHASLTPELAREAGRLSRGERYPWLRDRGLLVEYYKSMEAAAESIGRRLRERTRAIQPDFRFAVYLYAMPDIWFYRGFARGISTPKEPLLWMSFQAESRADLCRFRRDGRYILHAAALLLGEHPIADYPAVIAASRRWHDGYWINHLTKLVDVSTEPHDVEAPQGALDDAWKGIMEGNRRASADDLLAAPPAHSPPQHPTEQAPAH